jgi:cell wall-associated NlpC family hydrolase
MKVNQCKADTSSQKKLSPDGNLSYGDTIVEIGRLFINVPYKAGTLENLGKEKLIINVSGFDCTTFVETVLALTKCAVAGKLSRSEFRKYLKLIRYRQGKIDGYSSRLHYFIDWLRDNEKKKILKDVSRQFHAAAQCKKINYMTLNRASYPALKNEFEFQKMRLVEKNLSRKVFYIIDKDKVNRQKTRIKKGDVIAFATKDEGLDVAHVGFAIWQGNNLHLLHASSKESGVVISKKTLVAYLKSNKKFTGITIARFL